MIDVPTFELVSGAAGYAIYGALMFWSAKRRIPWLAVAVSLPPAMGALIYLVTPVEMAPQNNFVFRHFGEFVLGQFAFGALAYGVGRLARGASSRKDQSA